MLQVRGQPSNANGILGDYWYFLIRGALEGDNFITEYIVRVLIALFRKPRAVGPRVSEQGNKRLIAWQE